MGKRKEIPLEKRGAVLALHNEGISYREIAKKLKISLKGVHSTIKRFEDTGNHHDRPRTGRPKVTTSREGKHIVVTSKRNRRLTAPEICADINRSREKPVSLTTVKRRLNAAGLKRCVAVKKVRRSASEKMTPQCIVPTVKHGGSSVMVWGCFSGHGTGDLVKIDGIMRKEQYKNILVRHAIPSGLRGPGRGFVFQQDNDPKHTSILCRSYLEQKKPPRNMEGDDRNKSILATSPLTTTTIKVIAGLTPTRYTSIPAVVCCRLLKIMQMREKRGTNDEESFQPQPRADVFYPRSESRQGVVAHKPK
ncbi:uncharacterized protein LOC131675290 [Phymastichus coffea]|uniref:uncharacterized protein LOC131675290 n=1 Tax=Phymastichus coffea TaxID=108790 RepID=UPI00273CEEA5|nr:uncharacterized protein LOC131675290 [Phymastichus coffea]